jgi:hypothetical protein
MISSKPRMLQQFETTGFCIAVGKNKDESNSSSTFIIMNPQKGNVKLKTDPLIKKGHSKKKVPKVSETMIMKKSIQH